MPAAFPLPPCGYWGVLLSAAPRFPTNNPRKCEGYGIKLALNYARLNPRVGLAGFSPTLRDEIVGYPGKKDGMPIPQICKLHIQVA